MDELKAIVRKMTSMEEALAEIKIQLAKTNEAEYYRKDNFEKLVVKVNENRTKIVELEVRLTAINTKLVVFGVLASICFPLVTGFLMKLFFHNH